MRSIALCALVVGVAGASACADLIDVRTAHSGLNPFAGASYLGAGSGFGGTLGNGSISMNTDGTSLAVGFTPAGSLDNNVVIMLDTRAGGFRDTDMRDRADGGRRGISELSLDADDAFDANFLPDFGLVIGNFGIVLFELNAGNSDGHLIFQIFDGTFTGNGNNPRSINIPYSLLGIAPDSGAAVDYFAAYISDSGYASNESIPAYSPLQLNGNPGFGDGQFGGTVGTPGYGNYNRFVPTPGAAGLLGLAALSGLRRRR